MQHVTTIKIGGKFEEIIESFNDKSGRWSVSKFPLFWIWLLDVLGTGQSSDLGSFAIFYWVNTEFLIKATYTDREHLSTLSYLVMVAAWCGVQLLSFYYAHTQKQYREKKYCEQLLPPSPSINQWQNRTVPLHYFSAYPLRYRASGSHRIPLCWVKVIRRVGTHSH